MKALLSWLKPAKPVAPSRPTLQFGALTGVEHVTEETDARPIDHEAQPMQRAQITLPPGVTPVRRRTCAPWLMAQQIVDCCRMAADHAAQEGAQWPAPSSATRTLARVNVIFHAVGDEVLPHPGVNSAFVSWLDRHTPKLAASLVSNMFEEHVRPALLTDGAEHIKLHLANQNVSGVAKTNLFSVCFATPV